MNLLKDILYDAYESSIRSTAYFDKRRELSEQSLVYERKFLDSLSEEQEKLYEEFDQSTVELHEYEDAYTFITAFRYAVRLMVEIFMEED